MTLTLKEQEKDTSNWDYCKALLPSIVLIVTMNVFNI